MHICRQPQTFIRSSPLLHSLLEANVHLPTIDNKRSVPSSVVALLQSATDASGCLVIGRLVWLQHGPVQQAVDGPAVAEHYFRLFASNFRVLFPSQRLSHPRQRLHLPSRRIEKSDSTRLASWSRTHFTNRKTNNAMLLINVMDIINVLLCAHGCSVSDAVSWRRFVKRATQHVWPAGAEPTLPIAKRTTPCS